MTAKDILNELEALGNEKRKTHNIKHGATPDNQFGVKMGDVRKVAKKAKKIDLEQVQALWDSRIAEAQMVAILLWKPDNLSLDTLHRLVKTISFDYVADWFNSYIVNKHPERDQILQNWLQSDNKWALRAAWSIMASKIAKEANDLNLGALLEQIEREMPKVPSEAQWTMNFALAHIGIYHHEHRTRAIEVGHTLGMYKDYPVPRGCTSPFAPIWIEEMASREKANSK
ncbi:MAG: DNA alkylation repair protein [Cryomorphaceae bacterium]|nr:DNA alkylation repair protein [Cryomorphaceae bacterium]